MVDYYTPKTYSDGAKRSGAEQTDQEQRIDAGFTAAKSDIDTNTAQITAIKGSAGDPVSTLIALNNALTVNHNPGHTHDSSSITGLPVHSHSVANISDNSILARQANFSALAGGGWVAGNGISVMLHDAEIGNLQSDVTLIKGTGWASNQSLVTIFGLVQAGISPGHKHYATDISGIGGFINQTQLDAVKGSGWVAGETLHLIWQKVTTGSSPGHKHLTAEITDFNGVTTAQLDAVKGDGWTAAYTVKDNWSGIDATRGVGWTAAMTNRFLYDNYVDLALSDDTHTSQIFDLVNHIADLKGNDYGLDIQNQPTLVTGVVLKHPGGASGTAEGAYTLTFTLGTTTSSSLQWAGGTAVDIDSGDITYTLYDPSGSRYVLAQVTTANLPAATISESNIRVAPMSMTSIYQRVTAFDAQDLVEHGTNVHGNALVLAPTVTANGSNRVVTYSNVKAEINGQIYPSGSTTLSGTKTLTTTTATGGTLSSSQSKVDLLYVDTSGEVKVKNGDVFARASGVLNFPSVPVNAVAIKYILVVGNRSYIVTADLLGPELVMEWRGRRALILDALDIHGSGVNQDYGYGIEQPRLISGITLSIGRLFVVEQPTNINVVSLSQLVDSTRHTSHYNTSAPGKYNLVYTASGTTLKWGSGTAVNVSGGGVFTLYDSADGTTGIRASVETPLPGGDTSDLNLSVGNRAIPGVGTYDISYDASTGQLTFDGGTPTTINAATGYYHVPGSDGTYIGVYVDNVSALPIVDVADVIRVYWNGLTELDIKIEDALRRASTLPGTASQTGTPSRSFTIGQGESGGGFELGVGNHLVNRSLKYDSTSNTWLLDGGLALTAPNTLRIRRKTNATDQEYKWQSLYAQGTDFVDFDTSATGSTITTGMVGTPTWSAYKQFQIEPVTMQEYHFVRRFVLPPDFEEFTSTGADSTQPAIEVEYSTGSTDKFVTKTSIEVFKAGDASAVASALDAVSGTSNAITTTTLQQVELSGGTWAPGDVVVVVVRAYSSNGQPVRLHSTKLTYNTVPSQ